MSSHVSRYLGLGAVALVAFVLYSLYQRQLVKRKASAYAFAPRIVGTPWWDVLGVKRVVDMQKAMDEDRVLGFLQQMVDDVGVAYGHRHNTMEIHLAGRTGWFTTDPKNVQSVLALDFNSFGLGEDRIGSFLPMLGVGIFASDGKAWEHSRAMLRPNFAREQISDLSLEERHCQDLFAALPSTGASGWTPEFDMQPFFYKLTMDSATEFFFGESSHSLRASKDSEEMRFVAAFDRGQYYLGQRTSMGPYYWLMHSRAFSADCKIVHEWTDKRVAKALAKHHAAEKSGTYDAEEGSGKYVFLDELIQQTEDPIELRSQLLNVLIAGRDTTAGLLSWVLYLMARHPAEFTKLRTAVLETFGSFDSPNDVSFTSLKTCKPLQNVLKETLRLFPGVPFNLRQAFKDTTLPRGGGPKGDQPCFVPKGSQVFYSVYMMHRDKELWGPDAEEFNPDRWNTVRAGWEYLPFNGGPRICLGQQFSLTSAGYCIVRMLQRFDKVETTDTTPPKIHVALTAQSAKGVAIRLHAAEKA